MERESLRDAKIKLRPMLKIWRHVKTEADRLACYDKLNTPRKIAYWSCLEYRLRLANLRIGHIVSGGK